MVKRVQAGQRTHHMGCPAWPYRETGTSDASRYSCGGLFVYKNMKKITNLLILCLILAGFYFGINKIIPVITKQSSLKDIFPQSQTSSNKMIPLEEVKNLGYDFYVGQIDSSDNKDITDDLKNQITKIAYNAKFPVGMLKNIPIIILNNLALTGDQYIAVPAGNLKVPDLKPDFLSEGGIYVTFGNGSAIIFINKATVTQGQLTEVLTHELGHAIGSKLTDKDWVKFYQLRNIPSSTARHGTNWYLSPEEDFAEVYKNIFTGSDARTYWGILEPNYQGIFQSECMFDNTQSCYKKVMLNPTKYKSDWQYGIPYKSILDKVTKDFVANLMSKLNSK